MILRGRAWIFDGPLSADGDVLPRVFATKRETDTSLTVPHLFEECRPDLAAELHPGDMIFAPSGMLHGRLHLPPLEALRASGVGLCVGTMRESVARRVINTGIPLLRLGAGAPPPADDGDEVEVDYEASTVHNMVTGSVHHGSALPPVMLGVLEAGGLLQMLAQRLDVMPAPERG